MSIFDEINEVEDDKMTERDKKRHSKVNDENCCKKLSVFACVCAVVSLIVQTYDYVGVDLKCVHVDSRSYVENVLEEKFKEKFEAYLSDVTGFTSHRLKREAMLVSFK